MSRKDYEVIASGLISSIQLGYVKKKDILGAIRVMSNELTRNNARFDGAKFKDYILERI